MFKSVKLSLSIVAAGVVFVAAAFAANSGTLLPNGWRLTPAGFLIKLPGDMPLRIVAAPDRKSMILVTGGYHDHAIDVVDPEKRILRQHFPLGKAWAGLAVDTKTGSVYVSGGGPITEVFGKKTDPVESQSNPRERDLRVLAPQVESALSTPVLHLSWHAGSLVFQEPITIPGLAEQDRFIAGIATDARGNLFVINFQNDTLYKMDSATGHLLCSAKLGYRPFQLSISPDGTVVAVANWGDKSISVLDAQSLRERSLITVGEHPTDLAYAPDGRLFVANAGSNSVSVISGGRITETIVTSLRPNDPVGSTPNALAISAETGRLYVANADNNCVVVVDVHAAGHAHILGLIPTGWYPSALALTRDGKQLVVGVAKGISSRPNWPGLGGEERVSAAPSPVRFDYIGRVMTGYVEIIPVPGEAQLAAYTRQVLNNVPTGWQRVTLAERKQSEEAFQNIKHVIYIIKENHTYDEDLGDEPRGDGLKGLTLFGEPITPNLHAIVQQAPLLDRYFMNGEVSEDGHNWANSAYSTAYNERETASTYSGRGTPGTYVDAGERLLTSPDGILWDSVRRAGLTHYSYGELADPSVGDIYSAPIYFSESRGLEGHFCREWGKVFEKNDVDKAKIFIRDIKAAELTGEWPNFVIMTLPWNHTFGLTPGKSTPQAMVANNDLALGMIVDAVTHSGFWASTAIFVTEDDSQGGADHLDDHRSVGLVISPYTKVGFVDHTPYTMTSMVRTIELILHLRPMTQYDRDATPMYRLFQATPTIWTYSAKAETVDLEAVNPATGELAKASKELDFSQVDRADPEKLNAVLWSALKPGVPAPRLVHSPASLGLR